MRLVFVGSHVDYVFFYLSGNDKRDEFLSFVIRVRSIYHLLVNMNRFLLICSNIGYGLNQVRDPRLTIW